MLTARTLAVLSLLLGSALAAPFKFVALGDMPYNIPADYAQFDALIKTINQLNPAFSLHIGDIKSGSTPCSDENFEKVRAQFDRFAQPLVYTPGDNEWTDCHREKAGKFDPLERLAKVRQLFFKRGLSLGQTPMPVTHQDQLLENVRWSKEGVIFATLHVVGSNNGMERNSASVAEYFGRNAANLEWIKATFAQAKQQHAPAVVLAFQADLFFGTPFLLTEIGLRDTVNTIAAEAKAYGKPVLLVQGDSHSLVIDRPLLDSGAITTPGQSGAVLKNVTRLQVMGSDDVGAVEVTVDPESPAVFGFRAVYARP